MTIHLYKHKNVFLIDQNYRRHRWIKIKLWNKPKQEVLREDSKKNISFLSAPPPEDTFEKKQYLPRKIFTNCLE